MCFSDQIGYIMVQVEGNPAPTFKWYKVKKIIPHFCLANYYPAKWSGCNCHCSCWLFIWQNTGQEWLNWQSRRYCWKRL